MWIRLRLANLLHHSRVSGKKRAFNSWNGSCWKVLDSIRSIVHSPEHVQNRMIPVIYCFLDILAIGFNRFDIIKTTLSLRRHGHDGIAFLLLPSCLSSCCLIIFFLAFRVCTCIVGMLYKKVPMIYSWPYFSRCLMALLALLDRFLPLFALLPSSCLFLISLIWCAIHSWAGEHRSVFFSLLLLLILLSRFPCLLPPLFLPTCLRA